MKNIESKITIFSIVVGLAGIAITLYSMSETQSHDSGKHNITIVSSSPPNSNINTNSIVVNIPKQEPVSVTPNYPTEPTQTPSNLIHQKAHLTISATGAQVTIEAGDAQSPYTGGHIIAVGARQTLYLPKGQPLTVDLSGVGAKLQLSRSIAKQVNVNNTGLGADVSVF